MVGVLTSDAGVRRAELHFLQLCDYSAPGAGKNANGSPFVGARRAALHYLQLCGASAATLRQRLEKTQCGGYSAATL